MDMHMHQQQHQQGHSSQHTQGLQMNDGEHQVPLNGRSKRRKCNDLSAFTKWAIVARYMEEANRKTERLYTGSLPELCNQFQVSKRTIQRIVWEYKQQIEQGIRVPDMTNKKAGRGTESKFTMEVSDNIKKLKNKAKGRMTVRGMAEAYENEYGTKISYMTLYRYVFCLILLL
jgi:transposase